MIKKHQKANIVELRAYKKYGWVLVLVTKFLSLQPKN